MDVSDSGTKMGTSDYLFFIVVLAVFSVAHYLVASALEQSMKLHCLVLGLWLLCAVVLNAEVWTRHGDDAGTMWLAGYVLEWMLSMDNLFVFHLIILNFRTPPEERDKALFLGILGAVALRMAFFVVSYSFLNCFEAARYIFGLVLIYSGVKGAFFEEGDEEEFENSYTMYVLKSIFGSRLVPHYSERRVFLWGDDGKLRVTMLFPLICVMEVTDLVFAFDSVASKIGLIDDEAIALTSTVAAMFGLRSLFFIIEYLVECFELLKYGVGFILVFIGSEMLLHRVLDLSSTTALCVIMGVFFFSIGASLALPRGKEADQAGVEGDAVARGA